MRTHTLKVTTVSLDLCTSRKTLHIIENVEIENKEDSCLYSELTALPQVLTVKTTRVIENQENQQEEQPAMLRIKNLTCVIGGTEKIV